MKPDVSWKLWKSCDMLLQFLRSFEITSSNLKAFEVIWISLEIFEIICNHLKASYKDDGCPTRNPDKQGPREFIVLQHAANGESSSGESGLGKLGNRLVEAGVTGGSDRKCLVLKQRVFFFQVNLVRERNTFWLTITQSVLVTKYFQADNQSNAAC